jgi:hypothetical protein
MCATDASTPELVGIDASNDGSGDTNVAPTFSVDTPVALAAPPASRVIDGSQLGM